MSTKLLKSVPISFPCISVGLRLMAGVCMNCSLMSRPGQIWENRGQFIAIYFFLACPVEFPTGRDYSSGDRGNIGCPLNLSNQPHNVIRPQGNRQFVIFDYPFLFAYQVIPACLLNIQFRKRDLNSANPVSNVGYG